MKKEQFIEEIINGISEFKIIPFFGAGMSVPAGAVNWHELIERLKQELSSTSDDYLIVAQQYEERFGRLALVNKIKSYCTLKVKSSETLKNHLRILAMNPPIVYTTNFDDALESAADLLKRKYHKVIGLRDIVGLPHGSNQIIKFHGDFSDPSSIVFTKTDYEHRLQIERNPLDVLFRSHILGKSILFLGYSFSDRNIDFIFKLHADLYGTDVLHKSYIISFESDPIKESELRSKNIITLVLESPRELELLLNQIGEKVSENYFEDFFEDMNKSLIRPVITNFELDDLKKMFEEQKLSPTQLANKLRNAIELKEIPDDVEDELAEFIENILMNAYDVRIKKEIAFAFSHILFKKLASVIKIAFALMPLSEEPELTLGLGKNFEMDIPTLIEMKLGDCFGSTQSRKMMSVIILGYLEGMKSENTSLQFDHLDRLLYVLKNCRYEEFGDIKIGGYTKEKIASLLNYYFSQHDQTLKARFNVSIGSNRTGTEIKDSMLRMMPNNKLT